jgi:hypothetical protein
MAVTLTPSSAQQRVGTPVSWTAAVTGSQPGVTEFQFQGRKSANAFRLLRGFHPSNQIAWAPAEAEGDYSIQVTARNRSTGEIAVSEAQLQLTSNVTGSAPVISATANPLVALYSAPGCPTGSSMYVTFGAGSGSSNTNAIPCTPNSSMNFYIGGMLPGTTYQMNYVVTTGSSTVSGPVQQFTTGTIPPSLAFPDLLCIRVPDWRTSATQGILLLDYLSPPAGPYYFPTAIDLQGNILWYYPLLGVPAQDTTYFIRPIPNSQGHFLLIANDPTSTPAWGQILREIDLAGNTVTETYASQISAQLVAQGKLGITGFNHDAIRLPNGHTLVICSQERIYPAGTQGSQTAVDVLGDAIVDLDENWNVAWSWSAYDNLDVNRAAVLGETCAAAQAGCPQLILATKANDWLHANSLNYLPDTGDILLSIRHQDWVIKIDYANGAGPGDIIWKLGLDGDFSIQSSDPYPWFSHQHDAQLNTATGVFSAFDNGNTRVALAGGVGNSRGYVLQLDETNHAGYIPTPAAHAFTFELLPDGTQVTILEEFLQVYRAYRMSSMYSLP